MSAPRTISFPMLGTTKTVHAPASNTAAVVTLTAVASYHRAIKTIIWSYSAAPTGGRLTITDNAVTVLDMDITAAGPGILPIGMAFTENTQVVVTLAAGGAGISGKLTVESVRMRDE